MILALFGPYIFFLSPKTFLQVKVKKWRNDGLETFFRWNIDFAHVSGNFQHFLNFDLFYLSDLFYLIPFEIIEKLFSVVDNMFRVDLNHVFWVNQFVPCSLILLCYFNWINARLSKNIIPHNGVCLHTHFLLSSLFFLGVHHSWIPKKSSWIYRAIVTILSPLWMIGSCMG